MPEPLGLESKAVRVVPDDDRWPSLFETEAARILEAVESAGLPALAIEHVGSTAVPGLAAKPILDIGAGRPASLVSVGVCRRLRLTGNTSPRDGGPPGREFFRRGALRSHHLHLVEQDGVHWSRYLRFRDALRAKPALRDAYAELKRALAGEFPRD